MGRRSNAITSGRGNVRQQLAEVVPIVKRDEIAMNLEQGPVLGIVEKVVIGGLCQQFDRFGEVASTRKPYSFEQQTSGLVGLRARSSQCVDPRRAEVLL